MTDTPPVASARQRRVLALDMATSTGWALHVPGRPVTSGTQRFDLSRGETNGMRFLRFARWLRELGADLGPGDVIAFERAHHRGGPATEVGVGLMAHMMSVAAERGCETLPIHTATLKKHATGAGNAGKDLMVAAADKRWGRRPETDDEADALCVLAWALETCGVEDGW